MHQNITLILINRVKNGGKILFCGNGGSAADAQHLTAELVGQYLNHKRKPISAISLTTNSSTITSISTSPVFTSGAWESGYRYVLSYVKINDGVSELIFKNNRELDNVTLGTKSPHSVYYLDQFTFTNTDN